MVIIFTHNRTDLSASHPLILYLPIASTRVAVVSCTSLLLVLGASQDAQSLLLTAR